jgi:hypothetical protein
VADILRGRPQAGGPPGRAALIFDIATFRGYPGDGLVSAANRLLGAQSWPWALEPLLAPAG